MVPDPRHLDAGVGSACPEFSRIHAAVEKVWKGSSGTGSGFRPHSSVRCCFLRNPIGAALLDSGGLFRLLIEGFQVLWIPEKAGELNVRLTTWAHMREVGHRAVAATLIRLQSHHCWWKSVVAGVAEFVQQCLHGADSWAGERVPRPFGDAVHVSAPDDIVDFDFLYVGDSGPIGSDRLPDTSEICFIPVMMDDNKIFRLAEARHIVHGRGKQLVPCFFGARRWERLAHG